MAVGRLNFTRDWTKPGDFPPVAQNATQARANIQRLHEETRTYINETLVTDLNRLDGGKADKAALSSLSLEVGSHTGNKNNPHSVTALQVGADPRGTAEVAVQTHAQDEEAHKSLFSIKADQAELDRRLKTDASKNTLSLPNGGEVRVEEWKSEIGVGWASLSIFDPDGIQINHPYATLAYRPAGELCVPAFSSDFRTMAVVQVAYDGTVSVRSTFPEHSTMSGLVVSVLYHS